MATSKSKNTGRTKKNSKGKEGAVQAEFREVSDRNYNICDPGSLRDSDGK